MAHVRDFLNKFSNYVSRDTSKEFSKLLSFPPSEEKLDLEGFVERPDEAQSQSRTSAIIHKCFTLVLLLTTTILLFGRWHSESNFRRRCVQSTSVNSPGLDALVASPDVSYYFNGSFGGNKNWRAPPGPELDKLWKGIVGDPAYVPLSDDQVRALGKDPEQMHRVPLELRDKYGDGIIGGMEIFHQLHCLNMIRKYTYMEYYGEELLSYSTPHILRVHIDHCIDMVRQVIMCTGDTGMALSYWVEGRKLPMPDFSTLHKCRDFDAIVAWQQEHEIKEFEFVGTPAADEMIFRRPDRPDTAQ